MVQNNPGPLQILKKHLKHSRIRLLKGLLSAKSTFERFLHSQAEKLFNHPKASIFYMAGNHTSSSGCKLHQSRVDCIRRHQWRYHPGSRKRATVADPSKPQDSGNYPCDQQRRHICLAEQGCHIITDTSVHKHLFKRTAAYD